MGRLAGWAGKNLIRAAVLLALVSAASFFLLSLSPSTRFRAMWGRRLSAP